ncbi:MAG: hypothetical protein R3B09_26600 [Nannocystaceae bacterium]
MDFLEIAAAFDAEVQWTERGKVREPTRFTVRRGDAPEIHGYPEQVEGECVGVIFAVAVDGATDLPRIVLRREGALDRGGKALGINREVQLGDPEFDAAVYVESEAPAGPVQAVLAAATARAAAAALVRGPADEVVIGEGRVTAHLGAAELADPRAPRAQEALTHLASLATSVAVPKDMPSRAELVRRRPIGPMIGVALAWLAMMLVAALLRPPISIAWGSVWAAAGVGLALWALTCGALALALRGGHDSLRWVIVSGGFFLLVAPFAGMKGALAVNAALDGSAPTTMTRSARVIERGEERLLLEVKDLSPAEASGRLDVPRALLAGALPEGEFEVKITTRAGALGWAWLVGVGP